MNRNYLKSLKLTRIFLIICLSISLIAINPVYSQSPKLSPQQSPTIKPTSTPSDKLTPVESPSPSNHNDPPPDIWQQFLGIFFALLSAVLTAISTWLLTNKDTLQKRIQEKADELFNVKEELEGLYKPVIVSPNETVNSAMVIGLSGSGKTSLIKRITGDPNANPAISSAQYNIFSKSIDMPGDKPISRYRIYLSDYPGQTALAELIHGFIIQQSIPFSPMRFGYVNSLILVVDLFNPPNLPDDIIPKQEKLNEERIRENIEQWNEQALSAVFGMLPPNRSLKYVCLFINKIDLLKNRSSNEEIFAKYQVLYERLVDMAPTGIFYRRLVGSGITGENVITLEEDLKTYSVRYDRVANT